MDLILTNAALVFALMSTLWVVSVIKEDVSIVDPWWSIGFLLVTLNSAARSNQLLVWLVAVWALRLWLHLLWRSRGKPEDPRYAAFRQRFGAQRYWWISFFQVFMLQGVLVLVISAPLVLAASASEPLSILDLTGATVFGVGFMIEMVADRQLQRFRDARTAGVLDTGLWRYSRHPNYFGEALLWWGFFLFALDTRFGALTFPAPTLMTFLLLRVSGVTMLDTHLSRTRQGYAEYMRRTPAFFPRRPRG